jgi:outer membrane protein assembly factor BamB
VEWKYPTNGAVDSSPAANAGTVYVGSNDSNIYALSAATGAKLWSYNSNGGIGNASPEVANGVVYMTGNGFMIALNSASGAAVWTSPAGPTYIGTAVVSGGRLYAGRLTARSMRLGCHCR